LKLYHYRNSMSISMNKIVKWGFMENGESAMRNVLSNPSWFRDTPHYWAEAWLPLAYAVACVEVVCESSEKAGVVYNLLEAKIYHHCTNIGMTT
jgi:hypothetical protein